MPSGVSNQHIYIDLYMAASHI